MLSAHKRKVFCAPVGGVGNSGPFRSEGTVRPYRGGFVLLSSVVIPQPSLAIDAWGGVNDHAPTPKILGRELCEKKTHS